MCTFDLLDGTALGEFFVSYLVDEDRGLEVLLKPVPEHILKVSIPILLYKRTIVVDLVQQGSFILILSSLLGCPLIVVLTHLTAWL